jgi:hypothetical protein
MSKLIIWKNLPSRKSLLAYWMGTALAASVATGMLAAPAVAQGLDGLFSAGAAAKLVQGEELAEAFAAAPQDRQRVIITYRLELPAAAQSSNPIVADTALMAANAAAQSAVLSALAGAPVDGLKSMPSAE